jgi:hypothetical protein
MPMLSLRRAQWAFVIVTLVSICGALFRVATAPDRVRERRNLAYMRCIGSGGQWATIGKTEVCQKPGEPPLTIP